MIGAATLTRPVTGGTKTYFSLDLIRGCAALAVLVFHYKNFGRTGGALPVTVADLRHAPIVGHLTALVNHGSFAVLLFWAISGFVFTHIYSGQQGRVDGKTFFIHRFARLYPLHFLTLCAIAVLQVVAVAKLGTDVVYHPNDAYHFVLNLFFASEWGFSVDRSFNGPIWSVSVEVLVYLLFFLHLRFLPVTLLTLALPCLALVLALGMTDSAIVTCAAFFYGGACAYALHRQLAPHVAWYVEAMPGVLMVAAICAFLALGLPAPPGPTTLWALPAAAALLMALVAIEGRVGATMFRRVRLIGDITYSTYLWHSPIQVTIILLSAFGLFRYELILTPGFVLLYFATVCVIGLLSFRFIERPAQDAIRRRWPGRPAAAEKPERGRPAASAGRQLERNGKAQQGQAKSRADRAKKAQRVAGRFTLGQAQQPDRLAGAKQQRAPDPGRNRRHDDHDDEGAIHDRHRRRAGHHVKRDRGDATRRRFMR